MKKNTAFSLVELSVVILVIGILIAGITQSGRLIRQIKLSTARSVTSSSDVNSIRDVTAWFEASSEGNFTNINDVTDVENNDVIKLWNDVNPQKPKSDRPKLTNDATNKQPKYTANGINGIPSLYFDGDSTNPDHLFTTDIPTMPILSSDKTFSIFAVFRPDLGATKTKSIVTQIGNGTTLANDYISIGFWGDNNNNGKPGLIGNSTKVNNWLRDVTVSEQNDYIVGAIVDFSYDGNDSAKVKNQVALYVNSIDSVNTLVNGVDGFQSGITPTDIVLANGKFVVGANAAGTVSDAFKGMISEVIIFDRKLKDEEAKAVMGYLRKKYNINK